MISLAGNSVCLRALEPEDVDILYTWENDPRVWSVSETLAPFSRETLREFIENQRYDIYRTRQMRLIISRVDDGRPVGMIDLFDFDPVNLRAAVGVVICDERDRRKGYASEALDLLIDYSSEILNLHQLYCSVYSDNISSSQLFIGKGFVQAGIRRDWLRCDNGWRDEILFQKILF